MLYFIKLNDLPIKKFIRVILAFQLIVLGTIYLPNIGLNTIVFRQIAGFIYLTFIPGMIILRILNIHNLSIAKTAIYSIGLSIAFCMLFGLLINIILPIFGILKPLSLNSLTISFMLAICILCLLAYYTDKPFLVSAKFYRKKNLIPLVLFLLLLPILSIFGSFLVNFYGNNAFLLFVMILIVFIAISVVFEKFPTNLYCFAILSIALAIAYHGPFISNQLFASDMAAEYLAYRLTKLNSLWSPNYLSQPINMVLSVTILPTIYSTIMGLDGIWTFKIVFPTLIGFLPLTLYLSYKELLGRKKGFFATFFFMSYVAFFSISYEHARIAIAELFLALLILLMVEKDIGRRKKFALAIIFTISLIASYYVLSIFFVISAIFVWFVIIILKRIKKLNNDFQPMLANTPFILFLFSLLFLGFIYIKNTTLYIYIKRVYIKHAITSLTKGIFDFSRDPFVSQAVGLSSLPTIEYAIMVWLFRLTVLLIVVGVLKSLWNIWRKKRTPNVEYTLFSFANLSIFGISIITPFFIRVNIVRLYQMLLIFFSPFIITGGILFFHIILKIFRKRAPEKKLFFYLVIGILIPYYLLNSGFLFEVTRDQPISIPLSINRMLKSNSELIKVRGNFFIILPGEIESAKWLSIHRTGLPVYSDEISCGTILAPYGLMLVGKGVFSRYIYYEVPPSGYIYLRYLSVVHGLYVSRQIGSLYLEWNISTSEEIAWFFRDLGKVYANGVSEIYYCGEKTKNNKTQ